MQWWRVQDVCEETHEDEPSCNRKTQEPGGPDGGSQAPEMQGRGMYFSHWEWGMVDEWVAVWYMMKMTLEEDLLS